MSVELSYAEPPNDGRIYYQGSDGRWYLSWPADDRIDTIGQNGNDGEHYAKTCNFSGLSGEHYGNKYTRQCKGVEIDVYDVLKAFNVTCPALQHLIKKALCAGLRGHKDLQQDLQDIVDSAKRAQELNK